MKTNLLRYLLLASLLALAAFARADEEQDLIATLQSQAGAPQKCAACQKLRTVGTVKAVPALAALLGEERIAHAARYALEGMPYPEAVTALREALARTSGPIKAGLIDSLGWRQDAASIPLLTPLLSDSDATLASAAASSLARIGGLQATAALISARDKAPPAVQPAVLDGLLACAERLLGSGDAKGAAALYRDLFTEKFPERIRVAAWRGLVLADTGERAQLVQQALSGQDRPLHVVALKVVRELNDPQVVRACVQQWTALPADAQLAVLDADLKLGANALPTVRAAAQSPYVPVRIAAWQALADLGDPSAIPALAKAAAGGEGPERAAARDTLARLHGPGMREALLTSLDSAEPPEKAELLRALGERGDTEASKVLLLSAAGGPEPVRLAALEALRKLAVPDTIGPLLDLAVKARSDADRQPVLEALYAVCQASHDKEQATRSVLDALGPFSAAQRRQVLSVLAELATPAALEAAETATRDSDPELVKEAVRVLSQWPNAAPAPRLLELARSGDPTLRVLALRGCITVAAQEPDPAKRLALLQQARAAAQQPAEKKQALGQIGQIPTPEALQTAMADLADPALANEAGLAALTIAEKLVRTDPKLAEEAAAKVVAQCNNPDIARRAWALHRKPARRAPFIRDWLVCGPYTKPGVASALAVFDVPFGPEQPGEAVQWKPLPRGDMADLATFFPSQVNCCAYLKTQIIAPEACDATLLLGSDDGVKAWLNGKVVHSNNVDRGAVADQDMAPIQLQKGTNDLMLKITQGAGGWGAYARIVGSDNQPIKGLRFALASKAQ